MDFKCTPTLEKDKFNCEDSLCKTLEDELKLIMQ